MKIAGGEKITMFIILPPNWQVNDVQHTIWQHRTDQII